MGNKFQQLHLRIDVSSDKQITNIANKTGESKAEITRQLIKKGLAENITEENIDLISLIVRQQLEIALKPHIERLAALSSKSGHMSATAAFLNVQALMDLVPTENRKDVLAMYESARKKAVAYMKTKTTDWEGLNNECY